MKWLDNLFGAGQSQSDINRGAAAAASILNKGRDDAMNAYNAGTDAARTAITSGYGKAGDELVAADPMIRGDLNRGIDAGNAAITGAVDKANAYLDPFYQSGLKAQARYDDGLGLNGQSATDAFYGGMPADPSIAYRDELANKQIAQQFAATGNLGGRAGLAISRASLERRNGDTQAYLDRLEQAGARGAQYGAQMGSNAMTGGQIRSQNEVARGSALAGIGERLAGRKSDLATGQAGLMAGLEQGYGSKQADLIYGNAQQLGANEINRSNAVAATRGVGMKNLVSLAGTAIQGAALYNNWKS